jgi:integrase
MSIYRRKIHGKPVGRYVAEFHYRGQLYRQTGLPDRETAKHWINSEQLKLRRGEVGYVKPMLASRVAPLITEYAQSLVTAKRDEHYAYISEKRLTRLAEECGWMTLGHVTTASLERWRDEGPKYRGKRIGPKTINQIIQTAAEFGKWLRKPKHLLPVNPLADVALLREPGNPEYRRAATQEEFDTLLATCPKPRRLYYLFRLYVPVRTRAVRLTTWRMMHLDDEQPWILFPAAVNKSRKDERSPIPHFLAAQLRTAKKEAKAKADDPVFAECPTIDDLRADLATAGVAFDDGKGSRRLDFHAFRKTLVRWLKRAGVGMDDASLILHHKDIRTTRKHYDDDAVDPDLTAAVAKLPVVGKLKGGAA